MEVNRSEVRIYTEQEMMEALGLTKKQLDHLRWKQGFPCVPLSRTARVYLSQDVYDFIEHLSRQARRVAAGKM